MRIIKIPQLIEITDNNYPNCQAYRGVSKQEFQYIIKIGTIPPTSPSEQIPLDNEVCEYAFGDQWKEMSE